MFNDTKNTEKILENNSDPVWQSGNSCGEKILADLFRLREAIDIKPFAAFREDFIEFVNKNT